MSDQQRDRRFRVSGVDSFNDLQIFESDDRARAEAMRDEFAEDLQNVTLTDTAERP